MNENVLVLKTNITSKRKVQALKPVFNSHAAIQRWTIDTQDRDNVLRIEAHPNLKEEDIVTLVRKYGFDCEELSD
ncbi:MAG: hypothetical protein A3D92_15305 [Bacteroidetes bacterium RIFCSPHIGHO2_02_FULL_44_7]|nr:MAG: hypothetical protein A3D92_15305 [Bacteroidetes bacterium RIFCSPHIGHO2_02_FULL_44_7]